MMSREAERHNKMQTREANCLVQKVLLFRLATTTVPVGNNSVVVNRWLFTETLVGTLFYTVEATDRLFFARQTDLIVASNRRYCCCWLYYYDNDSSVVLMICSSNM